MTSTTMASMVHTNMRTGSDHGSADHHPQAIKFPNYPRLGVFIIWLLSPDSILLLAMKVQYLNELAY
jgi:hypothetical protein